MPDPDAVKATANVLEAMTKEVMQTKPQRGARLTPVGAERLIASIPEARPSPIAGVPVAFPYDDPQTMVNALRVALDEVDHVRKGIVTLIAALGGEVGPAEVVEVDVKAAERAADAAAAARAAVAGKTIVDGDEDPGVDSTAFAEDFKAKQEAAQAATFASAPEQPATVPDGWVCPEHGAYMDATSPKGRKFRRCANRPTCNQFER